MCAVADWVSRWPDWTEANVTISLGTLAPGEDIADTDVRRVVPDLVRRVHLHSGCATTERHRTSATSTTWYWPPSTVVAPKPTTVTSGSR